MKLGIFTDAHYSSIESPEWQRFNRRSLEKIKTAMKAFHAAGCDMVISLGELIDHEAEHEKETANLKQIAEVFASYDMPIAAVMGNHDAFSFEVNEYYGILGEQTRPTDRVIDGKTLLFIDACHFKTAEHYRRGDDARYEEAWTDTFYPYVEKLRCDLNTADGRCFVFMHQNVDPNIQADHRLSNDAALRKAFEQSQKVDTVFQGHFHGGADSVVNRIHYRTFPSMCASDDRYFIVEI